LPIIERRSMSKEYYNKSKVNLSANRNGEKIMAKYYLSEKIICLVLICVMLIISCNRKIAPSSHGSTITAYDSTKFDYVFAEALKQKFLGNAGDALKYLEQCVKLNPRADAAYYEMCQIYAMLGDFKLAKSNILKADKLSNDNIWYKILTANLYYQERNIDSTIYYYEKAVALRPDKVDLKINLAKILSENKNYKKASEIYEYLESKYGLNENTTLASVRNLVSAGELNKAKEKLEALIIKEPDEVIYNGMLAEIYTQQGEKEKATDIYNKLINKNPGDPQIQLSVCDFLITEKQYDDLFKLLNIITLNDSISKDNKLSVFGRILTDTTITKNYSSRIELSLIVLEAEYTEDQIVVLLRPDLYVSNNRLKDAEGRLEEIIKAQPQNYFAWEKLLIIYSELKEWDKLYSKGEACATNFNRAYIPKILYANAAIEKEKFDIATEELRKARILAGSDTDKIIQVLTMNADVYYRQKDYDQAFKIFQEALTYNPDDILILNNYAYYLAEQGKDLKNAETMARKVIELEKDNPTYLDTYAWVLYKRGKLKEAEKIMLMIVKNKSQDAEYYEHLGYIEKALRECEKAIAFWQEAYKLDNRKEALLKEIENCKKH
jgi:predicted Zn-dependent protease